MKVLLSVHTAPPYSFLMMRSYIGQRKRNTPVFDAVPPMNRVSKKSLIWMLWLGVRLGIALCSAGGHSKGNENSPSIFTPSDAYTDLSFCQWFIVASDWRWKSRC